MRNKLRFLSVVGITLVLTLNTMCLAWPFDLELTKEVDKLEVFEGDTVIFTIVVTNHGLGEPSDVTVEDVLPGGLSFQSFSATQGAYVSASGLWSVGALPSLEPPATLKLWALIEPDASGQTI